MESAQYAIITVDLLYDNDVSDNEKIIYQKLTLLQNSLGWVWASNEYLAKISGHSLRTVKRVVNSLYERKILTKVVLTDKNLKKIRFMHVQPAGARVTRERVLDLFQKKKINATEKNINKLLSAYVTLRKENLYMEIAEVTRGSNLTLSERDKKNPIGKGQKEPLELIKNKERINKEKRNLSVSLSDLPKSDHDNQKNISSDLVIKRTKQQPNLDSPIKPSDFELVWERYPKRGDSKKEAKTKWDIACRDKRVEIPTLREVLKGIRSHSKTKQWSEDKQVPMFVTWINQGRWDLSAERVDEKYNMVKEIESKKQTPKPKFSRHYIASKKEMDEISTGFKESIID